MKTDLIPDADYLAEQRRARPWWRTAFLEGALFGAFMIAATAVVPLLGFGQWMRPWRDELPRIALQALLFGALLGTFAIMGLRRTLRRTLECDDRVVTSAPLGLFDYRIAATLVRGRVVRLEGHLYVGPTDWVFTPVTIYRRGYRQNVVFEKDRVREVEVAHFTGRDPFSALVERGPRPAVKITTESDAFIFLIPQPARVATLLREYAGLERVPVDAA
jgi:hypothetical protein